MSSHPTVLTDPPPVIAALEQHLEDYWDQGFTEGSTRQPQPGPANETLSQIRALVRSALAEKDAEITALRCAVIAVCEDWQMPHDARKILESALWPGN